MYNEMTVAEYLINRLQKEDVKHVFGIPGDYVLKFFGELEKSPLEIIGTCSEQGAAFAADAYARLHGLGVLCITYCVGGLNTINAVAGAYAEKAPIIVISGAPGISERDSGYLLHHSIRDWDSQFKIYKEVTVASCQLEDPCEAPYEIDRVIDACIKYKRPVYIELPRDIINAKCPAIIPKKEKACIRNNESFQEAVNESVEIIKSAQKPVIIGGVEIKRYGLEKEFIKLLKNTGYPYATTILGKSIIDESHPQFIGLYMGKCGDDNIREYIEESDCTLLLGALMTDTNLGTAQLDISKTIYATTDCLRIKNHFYKEINLDEFIKALSEKLKNESSKNIFNYKKPSEFLVKPNDPIKAGRFFERLNSYIKEDTIVICDVGESLFGSADLKLPKGSVYIGPAFYTSMGYAIPACIGVTIQNPQIRPIILVGDGAFQMTGQEVSCFVKYDLKPIIFVLNNKGYTTQRYLKDGSFNDIQNWNYHLLPDVFGKGIGLEVKTELELEEALLIAEKNNNSYTLINLHLDKYDKSPSLSRFTDALSQKVNKNYY